MNFSRALKNITAIECDLLRLSTIEFVDFNPNPCIDGIMKGNLQLKERRFLEKYLEAKPLSECAKYAGYKCKDTASYASMGCQVLNRLNIDFGEILDSCGLTDSLLAQKTLEGLYADRPTYAIFKGQFIDERRDPDYSARAKYVEMLARLKGKFIDKTQITGPGGGDMTLVIAPATGGSKKKGVIEIE